MLTAGAQQMAADGGASEPEPEPESQGCLIGPDFAPLKLVAVLDYNHDSKIFVRLRSPAQNVQWSG